MSVTMEAFYDSVLFLFILLNPFLLSVFLLELMREMSSRQFALVLLRASAISGTVFAVFALGGETIFKVMRVSFDSFLVFGSTIFFITGIRMIFTGTTALQQLRGRPEHIAGSVAMPFMIGPGTVSASVLAGSQLTAFWALLSVILALVLAVAGLVLLKFIHDVVEKTKIGLVDRYVEIVGRISALYVGTIAVEMFAQGIQALFDHD